MSSYTECQQARQYALKNKYRSRNHQFIPKCRSDGTYSAVQCVEEHGCWCSDSSGKPIANTTTKNGKPNCKKFLRGIRRSSPRHMNPMAVQRDCLKADQTQFIGNIMQRFNDDYKGYNEVHHTAKSLDVSKELILNWKFSKYDINKNNILDKFEFRKLKQFIKKVRLDGFSHLFLIEIFLFSQLSPSNVLEHLPSSVIPTMMKSFP